MTLLRRIKDSFGQGSPPGRMELVKFDGFDELDKRYALDTFLEKTADEIARELAKQQSRYKSLSYIEVLSVMEPAGYQYYLAPYLMQMVNDETDDAPDLEFVSFVLCAVRGIISHRGPCAFSETQQDVLLDLITLLAAGSARRDPSDAFAESLPGDFEEIRYALLSHQGKA